MPFFSVFQLFKNTRATSITLNRKGSLLTVRFTCLCPRFFRMLDLLRTTLRTERSFLIWVKGIPQPSPWNMNCRLLMVVILDQACHLAISHNVARNFPVRFFPVSNIASMIVLYNMLWSKSTSASGRENKTIILPVTFESRDSLRFLIWYKSTTAVKKVQIANTGTVLL